MCGQSKIFCIKSVLPRAMSGSDFRQNRAKAEMTLGPVAEQGGGGAAQHYGGMFAVDRLPTAPS